MKLGCSVPYHQSYPPKYKITNAEIIEKIMLNRMMAEKLQILKMPLPTEF